MKDWWDELSSNPVNHKSYGRRVKFSCLIDDGVPVSGSFWLEAGEIIGLRYEPEVEFEDVWYYISQVLLK